jgi:nucleotide-binding universal stress UspA family protein
MSIKYLVACDGSPSSERAVAYAVEQARHNGGSVLIAHVLEWSPYSFLTPEELEERHKRRGEELARAKTALIDPILESISADDVEVDSVIKYGHVAETLADIATESGSTQLIIGRTGESSIKARVFGSVVATLAQIAPVPCTIVP